MVGRGLEIGSIGSLVSFKQPFEQQTALNSRKSRVLRQQNSVVRRRSTWLVFYHESVKSTAIKLKTLMGETADLSQLEWKRFDDGFPNLQIPKHDCQKIESYYGTCLIVSLHSPDVIFEQLCLMHELPRMRAKNYHVVLPWFCTGTMERVETLGQIATAKSLADLLSSCPPGPGGLATLMTFDIHWLQEQFYFQDRILIELKSALSLGRERIVEFSGTSTNRIVVAFPDAGAHEKIGEFFSDFPFIICDKVRDGDRRIVTFVEGEENIEGNHVVIIDDMVMSGGLMLECAKQLKSRNAARISCFTVHAVLPKEAYQKFIGNPLIHKFWITDTVPNTAKEVDGKDPFEILSIAPLVARYLMGHIGDS